jgi:hypothetical protein
MTQSFTCANQTLDVFFYFLSITRIRSGLFGTVLRGYGVIINNAEEPSIPLEAVLDGIWAEKLILDNEMIVWRGANA